ncbi:MAG: peptidylprolyl isomerase [Bacteroidia bacterium]|nr:peptidylprolyl isomerase [Bacteroidia bacterium]
MKGILVFIGSLLAVTPSFSQTIDRIVAVVGEEIILQSDVDNQFNYLLINGEKDDGTLRCQVLDQLIVGKLLLNKAEQDSLVVSDGQVSGEVDRRVKYFVDQMGTKERFEEVYGRSIEQFKADIAPDIRKELLTDAQRRALLADADVTPREVKKFFGEVNADSLGYLPAEVQLNHIVIQPKVSQESIERAKELLTDLQSQAANGKDFATLANQYTQEPGGRQRGGSLGWFGRGAMVPEFEAVVYQLRVGEVSQPFRTEFGYHIVRLNDKRGEMLSASHILRRLGTSADGDQAAIDSLNLILDLVSKDSLTFEQAAIRYSADRQTKHCGGCISNPQSGDLKIPMDALDADMYFKIDEMKEGETSEPMELIQPDGTKVYHVIYLKRKIPPHVPNLKDDYQKIRSAALQTKQADIFDKWLASAKKNIFIDIKPTECSEALKNWVE